MGSEISSWKGQKGKQKTESNQTSSPISETMMTGRTKSTLSSFNDTIFSSHDGYYDVYLYKRCLLFTCFAAFHIYVISTGCTSVCNIWSTTQFICSFKKNMITFLTSPTYVFNAEDKIREKLFLLGYKNILVKPKYCWRYLGKFCGSYLCCVQIFQYQEFWCAPWFHMTLSICTVMYLSVWLSIHLSLCLYTPICLSIRPSV